MQDISVQGGDVEEEDPLDLFMMGINQEVKDDKPTGRKPKPGLELDDDDDVAGFLEVIISFLFAT